MRDCVCVAESVVLGVRVGVRACDGVELSEREPVRDCEAERLDVVVAVRVALAVCEAEMLGAQAVLSA